MGLTGVFGRLSAYNNIRRVLSDQGISSDRIGDIIANIKKEVSIASKIKRLNLMQRLFKYWHVAHLPFALIMLIIVIVHVIAALAFGYKWIF